MTEHRAGARRGAWISMGVAAIAVATVVALLWNVPSMLAASVAVLPLSIDRSVGEAAAGDLRVGPALEAPAARAMLDEIVARLAPHVAEPRHAYRVELVESDEENAFALPVGRIVVFSGLVRAAASPEEIAGVLAHEMAHVARRHGLRNVDAYGRERRPRRTPTRSAPRPPRGSIRPRSRRSSGGCRRAPRPGSGAPRAGSRASPTLPRASSRWSRSRALEA